MPNPPKHALRGQETIEVGYGESNPAPLPLFVGPGKTSETIFIKMYISNEPMDLTWMVQPSPFHSTGTRGLPTWSRNSTAFHLRKYVIQITKDEARSMATQPTYDDGQLPCTS
jgi:hypothetical protein